MPTHQDGPNRRSVRGSAHTQGLSERRSGGVALGGIRVEPFGEDLVVSPRQPVSQPRWNNTGNRQPSYQQFVRDHRERIDIR